MKIANCLIVIFDEDESVVKMTREEVEELEMVTGCMIVVEEALGIAIPSPWLPALVRENRDARALKHTEGAC